VGTAILKGSGVKDSTIPVLVASIAVEVNASAGAQRSDPKSGDPIDYLKGLGPQADQIRIYNYFRCVRDTS